MIRFMNTASSMAISFVDQSSSQWFSYYNRKAEKTLIAKWVLMAWQPLIEGQKCSSLSTAKHLAYFSLYTWDVYRIWIRIEQILNFRVQYLILWFALLVIQKKYSHKKMLLTEVLPPGGNKKGSFSFYLAV